MQRLADSAALKSVAAIPARTIFTATPPKTMRIASTGTPPSTSRRSAQ